MFIKTTARLVFLVVLISVCTSATLACINPIGRSTVGDPIYVEGLSVADFLKALTTHEDQTYWTGVLRQLREPGGLFSDATEKETNTAVAMLHLGKIKEAIKILERLEKKRPGLYYTAANLGTAYELNGENAEALKWIREGVSRNPDAHHGSEWLHVKILEAKIALEEDPNWLANHSVLGINRASNEMLSASPTVSDHLGQPKDVKQIEAALIYQLHERLEFIKPPEGVVASLLFDLSRILSTTKGQEHGDVVSALAQTYGPDLMPWSVHKPPPPALAVPPSSTSFYWIGGASATLLGLLIAIVVVLLRRRKVT